MKKLKILKDTFTYFAFLLFIFYGVLFVKDLSKEKFQNEVYDYAVTNNYFSNKSVNFIYENKNQSIALLRRFNSFYNPYYNCEVVVNNDKYNEKYGDNDLAKEFIVAHELGHCELYDFMNNQFVSSTLKGDDLNEKILSFLSRNKNNTMHIHFEENLADYYATFVLLNKYNYSDEIYSMIRNFSQQRIDKITAVKEKFKGKVILDFWTHDIGKNVIDLLDEIKQNEAYYKALTMEEFKYLAFSLALHNTIKKISSDKDVIQSMILELIHYAEVDKKDIGLLYSLYPHPVIVDYIAVQYKKKGSEEITSQKFYIGNL